MPDVQRGRLLLWRVGSERYGVPLSQVREVLAPHPLTRIPSAPAVVRGLANVRGTVVTVLDGRLLFGYPAEDPAESLIVLALPGRVVGLEVDEVVDLGERQASGDWIEQEYLVPDLERLIAPLFGA